MVPCGVVVFLPSYDYEQTVVKRLAATGQLSKIESKKKIFREPKSTADLDNRDIYLSFFCLFQDN